MSEHTDQLAASLAERVRDFFSALDAAENDAIARSQKITEPYIDKKQAATFLDMSVKTLERRMALSNGPPRYIDGGKVTFLRSELRVWRRQWRVGDQTGLEELDGR